MTDWYGPDAATFGDRVAAAREAAGLGQSELANRLGVKESTVRKWEDDVSDPRANRLSMLAGVLNVSIVWLMTGQGDGIDPPHIAEQTSGNIGNILADIRALRAEMLTHAETVGRLEKRLRIALQEHEDVQA